MVPRRVVVTQLLATVAVGCDHQPPASAPTQAEAATAEDPALAALRADLYNTPRADVPAKLDRFRPLCDADGYPLVGNLARKVPNPPDEMGPSELCAAIRAAKGQ